jgi:hypothetical protein
VIKKIEVEKPSIGFSAGHKYIGIHVGLQSEMDLFGCFQAIFCGFLLGRIGIVLPKRLVR